MTLLEASRIYTDLVQAERETPETEPYAKDQLNALRTKYHELLMLTMRANGIEFSDRFDAANKAFEMVKDGVISCPLAGTIIFAEDDGSEE